MPQHNPAGKFAYYYNDKGIVLGPKNFNGRMWDNSGDFNVEVAINRYGFRDKKDLRDSTQEDVFVVGDSFSFGYGVIEEKRYSNLFEASTGIRTYNISIPGNFEDYEKLISYAKDNGATIRKIIIGVCMENDLLDYHHRKKVAYTSSAYKRSYIQKVKNYLDYRSTTYNAVAALAHSNKGFEEFLKKIGIIGVSSEQINASTYQQDVLISSARKLKELVGSFQATILIIPSRGLWIGGNEKTEKIVHEKFTSMLVADGLRIVDMKPIFEEGGNPLQYHFPHNGHWNEKGHKLAAAALCAMINKHRFSRSDLI